MLKLHQSTVPRRENLPIHLRLRRKQWCRLACNWNSFCDFGRNGNKSKQVEANPFDDHDEEWDENDNSENVLTDNGESDIWNDFESRENDFKFVGEPGVPVKALYDYDGAESDELTFKQGEVFEKLEDEDEQGWCKGRIKGRVGLYPANYVEAV